MICNGNSLIHIRHSSVNRRYLFLQSVYHRTLRRTVMRYVNLSTVLVFRLVSVKVHARFPTYKSMIDANLMLPDEAARLRAIDRKTPHESTWIPFVWAMALLQEARDEKRIQVGVIHYIYRAIRCLPKNIR